MANFQKARIDVFVVKIAFCVSVGNVKMPSGNVPTDMRVRCSVAAGRPTSSVHERIPICYFLPEVLLQEMHAQKHVPVLNSEALRCKDAKTVRRQHPSPFYYKRKRHEIHGQHSLK